MKNEIIAQYAERVFAYALKRTFNYNEAEELSQEILVTAINELPKLKNQESFEPFLWGIASNVTKSFSRKMGKQRAMFIYDVPVEMICEDSSDINTEEELSELRKHIAMLSKAYRDIIIFHYYDNLSVKQISEKLGIPAGTVTWRLSEARNKLNKEYNDMNETALRPKQLELNIHGMGNYDGKERPFPTEYISDALSQNILCHCYDEAQSIESLAKLCGVPAYYIEDRIENLLKRQAVVEQTKGKYRTDFVIWTNKYGKYLNENAEKALYPVADKLVEAIKRITEDARNIDFYRAGKSDDDLFYLYGAMAFDYLRCRFCRLPYPPMKPKYDGFPWCYHGSVETEENPRWSITIQHCGNNGIKGRFTHTSYLYFGGLSSRQMMYDNYINACEDIIYKGATEDTESAAFAIRDGYITQHEDGSLFVNCPSFTVEQKNRFDELVKKYILPLADEYTECTENLICGYKKLFPKHLHDEADRFCHHMFFGLYSVIVNYAQKSGKVKTPSPNNYCDVMLQIS